MLRATNLALVLYMLLYSPFCGAEIGGGSLRNHLNEKQSSRVETIDIRDAGGKTRKNSFELKMTMPGAHSIKVCGVFFLNFLWKGCRENTSCVHFYKYASSIDLLTRRGADKMLYTKA